MVALRRKHRPVNLWNELKEMEKFFQGKDAVHKAMRRLVRNLERADIDYAVVGGLALSAHRHRRVTTDVDVLLTREGFAEFRRRYVPRNYKTVRGRPRRFVDRVNGVTLDMLITGRFPGSGEPGPIAFPNPKDVARTVNKISYVNLRTLIELKLAARRLQDSADVMKLIAANRLDESFADGLHPSVRRHYLECVDEQRREAEYDARQMGAEDEIEE